MAFASKKTIYTSALGTAEPYAYIAKPDYGNGKFKNDRGVYKVQLTIPNTKCQGMINAIVKCHEEDYANRVEEFKANPPQVARGKKPQKPYEGDLPFCENEDGTTTFFFKGYASYTDRKTGENKPIVLRVVDSKGKRIEDVPMITGGSKLKVKFSMIPYGWSAVAGASVKLQLEAVQLIELASFNGADDDDDWGDDTYEGGYVASSAPRRSPESDAVESVDFGADDDDDEEDF